MNLTWHIVLKDLRRLWPWLALLVAAMLARYLHLSVPAYAPDPNDLNAIWRRAGMIDDILLGLSLFATALATATLVHEDAVVGDRTFWLTRPISGARLLAAKILTALLALVLLPLAVQLGWWLLNGYNLADIAAQVPQLFARQAGTAFAAFVCALLTRNLGSFLLTAIIGTLGVVYAHVIVNELIKLSSRTDDFNRERLELILALIALPACVVHQYLTRQTRRTIVLFVCTLLLGLAINALWPWTVFKKPERFSELPAMAADPGIAVSASSPVPTFQSRQIRTHDTSQPQAQKVPALAFDLTFSPIPAGHAVEILAAGFPKNSPVTLSHNQRVTLPRPVFPADYSHTDRLLIFGKRNPAREKTSPGIDSRIPEIPVSIDNTLTLALRRPLVLARLPLTPDASAALGARRLRIAAIKNSPENIATPIANGAKVTRPTLYSPQTTALILDEQLPGFLLSAENAYAESDTDSSFFNYADSPRGEGHSRHAYFLVSRSDGTSFRATLVLSQASLSVDGVRRRLIRAEFPVLLREADLADYELVKVIAPLVGTFTRTLTFPATPWTEPASP